MQLQLIRKKNNTGFILLPVAVIGVALALIFVSFFSIVEGVRKDEATVDHKEEFQSNVAALQLILEDPSSCNLHGSVNAAGIPPFPVTVNIPGGAGAAFVGAGLSTGYLKVTQLSITSLTVLNAAPNSPEYMATLNFLQSPGFSLGTQYSQNIYLYVDLTGTTVSNCYGAGVGLSSGAASLTGPASCLYPVTASTNNCWFYANAPNCFGGGVSLPNFINQCSNDPSQTDFEQGFCYPGYSLAACGFFAGPDTSAGTLTKMGAYPASSGACSATCLNPSGASCINSNEVRYNCTME